MNLVQCGRALLALIAASHVVVPVVMLADPDPTRRQVIADHPQFDAATVTASVDAALVAAAVFHGLLFALAALLIWRLPTGRPWTRRLATVSQLLSVAFGVVSWSSSPQFHAVIPIVSAAEAAVVLLLWLPRSSRAFFARHRTPAPALTTTA
ncbi:hypothetical protein ACQP00_30435 [Dactylosporangium sp. CS-047395]|uniref:hypothetical protein n=1 Tax=Dactylosporangium sp. CS-047395 TaxID=3239936 RepID=UPI003D8DFB0D